MLTPADKYKLSTYNTIALLHETEQCRVELVVCSLNGCEYVKRSYHEDKRQIFDALCKIKSPFIPQIYELFFDDDTIIIEEYAMGEKLDGIIARGELSAEKLSRITDDLLCAIKALHDNKIIHRDIKPENIIVAENGLKLIDYGIARLYKANEEHDTSQLGTRGYAAPEQYGFGQSGPRTDIYAFGKTVLALCDACRAKGSVRSAAAICARFDPQNRFPDAEAVRRYIKRKKMLPALCVCGMAAISIVVFFLFLFPRHISESKTTAPVSSDIQMSVVPSYDMSDRPYIVSDDVKKGHSSAQKNESEAEQMVQQPETAKKTVKTDKNQNKDTNAAASTVKYKNDLITGPDDERVVIQIDNNYYPSLLMNDTYGRSAKHAAVTLAGCKVKAAARMEGEKLFLTLSDERGHRADYTFAYIPPETTNAQGEMSYDGEILFFDLDDDGTPEIFPVIAKRRKILDKNTKQLMMYAIEQNVGWCISYDPKTGFTRHEKSIQSQPPLNATRKAGLLRFSVLGDYRGFSPGFILTSGDFIDMMELTKTGPAVQEK